MNNGKKKFISIIWGYHKQIFTFTKEQNYHMLPLEAMMEEGYECEIFAIDSKVRIEDDPNFVKGVNVIYYKNIFQYLYYIFKNRKARIYSNSLTIKTLLVGMIGKKTVFMAHDQTLPIESKKLKRIIVLFFYRFFSTIRVINKGESELLDKYKIKNCIIPLALSKSFYSSNIGNRKNGIFIGNLYEDKDPEFLINVIKYVRKEYSDFILNIIGEDRYNKNGISFKQLIKMEGIDGNIKVLGFIPHSELKTYLSKSLIYINTSISEGQCLAVYEAALSGCILCLPNILSFPSVFGKNAHYHSSQRELSNNIISCILNKDKEMCKIKENQKMIMQDYNYENIKNKTKELFLSL